MNPYAVNLGERDPWVVIENTPDQLAVLLTQMGDAGAARPWAPGKWNTHQILTHLADAEVAFAFRLRQAAAETHHVIQPFDQDAWQQQYKSFDAATALEVFRVLRRWNVQFLRGLRAEVQNKPVTHPERGDMQFRTIVKTMGGHDLNHLKQVEEAALVK